MASLQDRIKAHMARDKVSEDVIVRDMLQARVLSAIFHNQVKREVILKGGLAMRIGFGSHRYTSDIDMQTGHDIPIARIQELMRNAIKIALGSGILENCVITEPKQTETVQRWKINGRIAGGVSQVNLKLEISRRGMPSVDMTQKASENKTGLSMVEHYSAAAIASEKLDALLCPQRVAVRDLYDLDVLISLSVEPPIEALKALGRDGIEKAQREVWSKIETMTWDLAQQDLLPSLPAALRSRMDEDTWETMRLRTAEAIDGWMHQAKSELQEELPTYA